MGDATPSPFVGENRQYRGGLLLPPKYGIENLYDRKESGMIPQLYNRINEIIKELDPGFFKYWGDQMDDDKMAGSKAPIDEIFPQNY